MQVLPVPQTKEVAGQYLWHQLFGLVSHGKKAGTFGKGAMAWRTLMWEYFNCVYDLAICECTYLYQRRHIQIVVGRIGAVVSSVVFSPMGIGCPAERPRKYMIILFPGMRWSGGRVFTTAHFLNTFRRLVVTTGDVYLEHTTRVETRSYIEDMAKKRHMAIRDGCGSRWPMAMALLRGALKRLNLLQEQALKKYKADDELYFTIDRNPGWASVMKKEIPTLLQKTACWLTKAKRLLLPKEVCLVLGIPWSRLIATLPEIKVRSTAGNAMHAGSIAALILYALANTE